MTTSHLGQTSVEPLKSWTSPFNGSLNGPGLKTMSINTYTCGVINIPRVHNSLG